jgi:hypothetical protein
MDWTEHVHVDVGRAAAAGELEVQLAGQDALAAARLACYQNGQRILLLARTAP